MWLNFSKSGISLSFGGKRITTNLNTSGAQTTIDLPGSGVSYVSKRRKGCLKFTLILLALCTAVALYFILT
jgi:hypothetical protein